MAGDPEFRRRRASAQARRGDDRARRPVGQPGHRCRGVAVVRVARRSGAPGRHRPERSGGGGVHLGHQRPKGVMLSHANIVANVKAVAERLPADDADVFLSFLPLSHTLERTCGYYYSIAAGASVAFARSSKQLIDDFKEVRPTVVVSVPRIYERFYSAIMERRAAIGPAERSMFDLALAVGGRRFDARQRGEEPSAEDRNAWPALERAVALPVRAIFGGRLRIAFTGGAPIGEPVIRLFLSLGLDILQGYGMTECSPVVSVNTPDDNDVRSVGRPLPGVEAKLGANEELMVRGPNVMVGYWNRPEETRRVKEPDGWLHTGDQARIENGRIYITGRIKDIIVTSTGEKVSRLATSR